MIVYGEKNVLEAAEERISYVFDHFKNIVVSVSSGKDSTCLYNLALAEAVKRNRKIRCFFLDQEAEYRSTIDQMHILMNHPHIIPCWFQVEIKMTNATSNTEYFLNCFDKGKEKEWIHGKDPMSIHEINEPYPDRFYSFFTWYEQQFAEPTAFLVGLRSKESLNRFRAVTKHPGYKDIGWSTKTSCPHTFRFYPIYDWCFPDVWKYIYDNKFPYNRIYDYEFIKNGQNISKMRVSNLIHEKSFRVLADLQEFEPDTYDRLEKRLSGVHCAGLYAKDKYVYSTDNLPKTFKTWKEYRDYLLETTPCDKKYRFVNRFAKQLQSESVYKQQCKQLLLNDWENSMTVNQKKDKKRKETMEKWRKIL